jgi:hypothetical protein
MADSLISEGASWDFDYIARAAYNSQNGEFLVVWSAFNVLAPQNDPKFFGPVRGQRIKENGTRIGLPFDIFPAGVLPDVAYNAQQNEYLVVTEQWLNLVGQRLDGSGNKIGGESALIPNARFPRVVYNSLLGNYLVAGGALVPGSNQVLCTLQLAADGTPLGGINMPASDWSHPSISLPGDMVNNFALAYAPLENADPVHGSNATPGGRYLVAFGPSWPYMLDATGKVVPAVVDAYYKGQWYGALPFPLTNVLVPYSVDVAFGYVGADPVFFFVWSDSGQQNYPGYGAWTGVEGATFSAARTCYLSNEPHLAGTAFPISWIKFHVFASYKEWRPRVAYNSAAKEFVVAWRETPTSDPSDATVNHIRLNTSKGGGLPPATNTVLSSLAANVNPWTPFVASSTTSTSALVGWLDFRWLLGRTFGVYVDMATRQISQF